MKTILVTGGAGFIGSAFVRLALKKGCKVVVLDKFTYAGNIKNLPVDGNLSVYAGDIANELNVSSLIGKYTPEAIINFAAESHVDRSIENADDFIRTNILGTYNLIKATQSFLERGELDPSFKFIQVSTDEVFGSLELDSKTKFTEDTKYDPRSPYSASKASADFLVKSWFHTYNFPGIITNCSNNYGPRQYPEKLIPKLILSAFNNEPMKIYGEGKNVRDWIHVDDHVNGIWLVLEKGKLGESYLFGGHAERSNLEVAETICRLIPEVLGTGPNQKEYLKLITFVNDRPGHDLRYAVDDFKAGLLLGYVREYTSFEYGLKQTIDWYYNNLDWIKKDK